MFDKILILSASAGAGHVRAGQALERAVQDLGAAREVRHVDILEFTTKVFRRLYSQAYLEMVESAPSVLGWLYDAMDVPWKSDKLRFGLEKLNSRRFIALLEKEDPEITVSTHFLPPGLISWLKAHGRARARQAIAVTDFDVHAMWLCGDCEHYFVALEETKLHLEKLGIAAEKVTVSGIPIDPVFALAKDKAEARRKHGLLPDRLTILISAGGFGVGPIERLVKTLLDLRHPAQVVAVAGRSEELKAKLEALRGGIPAGHRVSLHVEGYTREMDEFMAAADILLGKPGGLTTSEALAKGLPLVIVNPIPGQEERNADHLLEEGAAIRCNNLPVLAEKIDRLLAEPARFASLKENARRLGRPDAARDVVRKLLQLKTGWKPAERAAGEACP